MRASNRISSMLLAAPSLLMLFGPAGCSANFHFFKWNNAPSGAAAQPAADSAPSAPSLLGGVAGSPGAIIAESENGEADASKMTPLAVSVAQAFFVGEQLQVKVRLEAKTTVPAAQIVVSVLGLKDGEVVEKHHQLVSRLELLRDEQLSRGQSLLIPFELVGKDLSEYQVQCRWGNDAVQFAAREQLDQAKPESPAGEREKVSASADSQPPAPAASTADMPGAPDETARAALAPEPPSGKLELRDVELEEEIAVCDHPPCDRRYVLRARLLNGGPTPLTELELGVGLAWAEAKSLPKPPADYAPKRDREETVNLKQIVLKTGEAKKLKIKIDRSVPVVPGGAFLPYIRIVHAKAVS